ncbi:MAG: TrkA family potassium uptake protein [Thermoleophilia bacterium]|nr:TrkA family potassium uptake protein [Thermoleophilia bacterium]
MYIVIVGAGRTGEAVIELATSDQHEVVVIEKDEDRAEVISSRYDCLVINDDASSIDVLRDAKVQNCDALVATTDDDAVNLLVMMMGKELGAANLVSSVNRNDHLKLFEHMDVDTVESPHRLNGRYLYRTIQRPGIKEYLDVGKGAEIIELRVEREAPVEGKTLLDIKGMNLLPQNSVVVAIERGEDLIVPDGSTSLLADDEIIVFFRQTASREVLKSFRSSS